MNNLLAECSANTDYSSSDTASDGRCYTCRSWCCNACHAPDNAIDNSQTCRGCGTAADTARLQSGICRRYTRVDRLRLLAYFLPSDASLVHAVGININHVSGFVVGETNGCAVRQLVSIPGNSIVGWPPEGTKSAEEQARRIVYAIRAWATSRPPTEVGLPTRVGQAGRSIAQG